MLAFALGVITIIAFFIVIVLVISTISWAYDVGLLHFLLGLVVAGAILWAFVSLSIALGETVLAIGSRYYQ